MFRRVVQNVGIMIATAALVAGWGLLDRESGLESWFELREQVRTATENLDRYKLEARSLDRESRGP